MVRVIARFVQPFPADALEDKGWVWTLRTSKGVLEMRGWKCKLYLCLNSVDFFFQGLVEEGRGGGADVISLTFIQLRRWILRDDSTNVMIITFVLETASLLTSLPPPRSPPSSSSPPPP